MLTFLRLLHPLWPMLTQYLNHILLIWLGLYQSYITPIYVPNVVYISQIFHPYTTLLLISKYSAFSILDFLNVFLLLTARTFLFQLIRFILIQPLKQITSYILEPLWQKTHYFPKPFQHLTSHLTINILLAGTQPNIIGQMSEQTCVFRHLTDKRMKIKNSKHRSNVSCIYYGSDI